MAQELSREQQAALHLITLKGKVEVAESHFAQVQADNKAALEQADRKRQDALKRAQQVYDAARAKAEEAYEQAEAQAREREQEAEQAIAQAQQEFTTYQEQVRSELGLSLDWLNPRPSGGRTRV